MKYLPLTYRTGDSQPSNQICTFANFILAVTVYTVARKITYQVTTTLVLYTRRCKRLQSIERVLKATSSIHIFSVSRERTGLSLPLARRCMDPGPHQDHESSEMTGNPIKNKLGDICIRPRSRELVVNNGKKK